MSKQKIIGIFGCEQTDLCIYLASILENMKNSVLVIDNSFEQKMRFCIPRPNEKMNMITYKMWITQHFVSAVCGKQKVMTMSL